MSRIGTLRLLLAVTAAAWAMIFTAFVGLVVMHLASRPQPRVVYYEHVYAPAHAVRPIRVMTPHGPIYCCPPPPCCPPGYTAVHYVPYTPKPKAPMWPFALLGILGGGAIVSTIVSRRRVMPLHP